VALTSSDYSSLILAPNFASSTSTTYAVVAAGVTKSTDGLEDAGAVLDGAAVRATTFVADELKPAFSSWQMDMDSGVMTMSFGEPVNASSFDATGVNFQAASNLGMAEGAETIALAGTNVTVTSPDGLVQTIDVGRANMNAVKALAPLGITQGQLYLSLNKPCFADLSGNTLSLA
jgi:hypothetical protein